MKERHSSLASNSSTKKAIRTGKIKSFKGPKTREKVIAEVARIYKVPEEFVKELSDEFFDGKGGIYDRIKANIRFNILYLARFIPKRSNKSIQKRRDWIHDKSQKGVRTRKDVRYRRYYHLKAMEKIDLINQRRVAFGLRPLDPVKDRHRLWKIPIKKAKKYSKKRSYYIPRIKEQLEGLQGKKRDRRDYKPIIKTKTEMKATSSGSFNPVELPKPTTTVARCYSVIDIGTVVETYEGKTLGKKPKVYITLELPEFKAVFNPEKGEEPFVIGREFTLSTNENSNLAKFVIQMRNRGFDEKELTEFDPGVMIDKTCMISFTVKTKSKFKGTDIKVPTNENSILSITGVMQRPKSIPKPVALNPTFRFDWDEPFDQDKFAKIPKFLRDKIITSDEWNAMDKNKRDAVESQLAGDSAQQSTTTAAEGELGEDNW